MHWAPVAPAIVIAWSQYNSGAALLPPRSSERECLKTNLYQLCQSRVSASTRMCASMGAGFWVGQSGPRSQLFPNADYYLMCSFHPLLSHPWCKFSEWEEPEGLCFLCWSTAGSLQLRAQQHWPVSFLGWFSALAAICQLKCVMLNILCNSENI
jgi:hypothetical protein